MTILGDGMSKIGFRCFVRVLDCAGDDGDREIKYLVVCCTLYN